MKHVSFETFKEWIEEVYPEISISDPNEEGICSTSLAGCCGPFIVCDKGVDIIYNDELPWDYTAKEIEWKARDLLDGEFAGRIDFKNEAEELLKVAQRVREKLENAGLKRMDTSEYIVGEYSSGLEYILVPFEDKYVDELGKIISEDFFNSIMDESEEPRKTYREYLKKEEGI